MTLETALQLILIAVVTFAVTAGIKAASKAWGRDLTGAITPAIAVGVALVTAYSPQIAALIPPEYHLAILAIAGALFGGGIHSITKRKTAPDPVHTPPMDDDLLDLIRRTKYK